MSEKLKILKMVEDGVISSEEALKLMEAMEDEPAVNISNKKVDYRGKKLKVKVFDPEENTKVDVKIPLSLVKLGFKIGSKFSPEFQAKIGDIDIEEVIQSALDEFNETGSQTIVDIEQENGTMVKVIIE